MHTQLSSLSSFLLVVTLCCAPLDALAQNFHGYPCLEDCSGHEASYDWAEKHDIDDADDCGGKSNSFVEGCEAYATEREEELEEDADTLDEDE
jgi:hypothetical protein